MSEPPTSGHQLRAQSRSERSVVLELRGVTRVHGKGEVAVHALRGVSLHVTAGELVAD